jgi:Helix-turn-helix domain
MATSPRQGPVSLPPDGQTGGRLHIHGIKEMPAGYDAEVAELFRDLRSASGLSEADLAAQLATRPEVVQALEQGALYALPPWPETYRVVATYGTLLNLDVRPLLRRIYAQVDAGVVGLAPKAMPDVPFMAPPEPATHDVKGQAPAATAPVRDVPPMQPRQPPQGQPRGPQMQPNRLPPPHQAQTQQRQPYQNAQPLPHQQPPWPPQSRGAPPGPGARMATPPPPLQQPRPMSPSTPREGRVPPQPQPPLPRSPAPPRAVAEEEKPPRKAFPWKAIIRWGVIVLVLAGIAAGAWMWFAKSGPAGPGPGQPGAKSTNKAAPSDPNDPRSRKADRLPGPS